MACHSVHSGVIPSQTIFHIHYNERLPTRNGCVPRSPDLEEFITSNGSMCTPYGTYSGFRRRRQAKPDGTKSSCQIGDPVTLTSSRVAPPSDLPPHNLHRPLPIHNLQSNTPAQPALHSRHGLHVYLRLELSPSARRRRPRLDITNQRNQPALGQETYPRHPSFRTTLNQQSSCHGCL